MLFKCPHYIVVVECSLFQRCIVFEPHIFVGLVFFPAELLGIDVPVHESIFYPCLGSFLTIPVSHKVGIPCRSHPALCCLSCLLSAGICTSGTCATQQVFWAPVVLVSEACSWGSTLHYLVSILWLVPSCRIFSLCHM